MNDYRIEDDDHDDKKGFTSEGFDVEYMGGQLALPLPEMAIGTKDTLTQKIGHGLLHDMTLLVCPKVGLQDVFKTIGIVDHNVATGSRDGASPGLAVLFMEAVVQLGNLGHGQTEEEQQVANEGQSTGSGDVGAAGADGVVTVLDEIVGNEETQGGLGSVVAFECLEQELECCRRLGCLRKICQC